MAGLARIPFVSYNLGPIGEAVDDTRAVVELNALANNKPRRLRRRPKVIALTECVGRDLPDLDHFHLVRNRERPGRGNLALYVRDDLTLGETTWVDHQQTWERVKHPGTHPPRATLVQEVLGDGRVVVVVGHAPQVDGANTASARGEWLGITANILSIHKRVLWLGDPNGMTSAVRRRLADPESVAFGDPDDAVMARGYYLDHVRRPQRVNGVWLRSDHHHAIIGTAKRR